MAAMRAIVAWLTAATAATAANLDVELAEVELSYYNKQKQNRSYLPCPDCLIFSSETWKDALLDSCSDRVIHSKSGREAMLGCTRRAERKVFQFPAGIFEIDEQVLVPAGVSILGADKPNDMAEPTKTPDWKTQTLFLATKGVTDYKMNYCHAKDMVTTRVGFVLSDNVTMQNINYQGIDTIRPSDNGALCGGGAFETKGCAENDCKKSSVNNGGSDGQGVRNVILDNIRINDFFFAEDSIKVGRSIAGNYQCKTDHWMEQCCFCQPNGVRSTQLAVWVPDTRGQQGSSEIRVSNLVMRSAQADGINLHGKVSNATVVNVFIENTGDDTYALWGANANPQDILFKDCVAINPGIMRPKWYGNCVATYGLKSVVFENITCKASSPEDPIPQPGSGEIMIDTSMFVFYTSFGGSYPSDNAVCIRGASFMNLSGQKYTPLEGSLKVYEPHKMVWTPTEDGVLAPFYLPSKTQQVNVKACLSGSTDCC